MSGFKRSGYSDVQDLKRLLTDQYDQRSLWKELVQNADDAKSKHLHFCLMTEMPGHENSLLAAPALCVLNDGKFSKHDAERIPYMGIGSKGADQGAIGKFGLGMKSIFHLCEAFFYLASPNQEAAKEGHFWECLNPWEDTDIHPEWDTGCRNALKNMAAPLVERIEGWPHGQRQWFALWIPLRTKQQINGKAPLVESYFQPQDILPSDLSATLANLLPLIQNVETISAWDDNGKQLRFSLTVPPETTRRKGPNNLSLGSEYKLHGNIVTTRSNDQQTTSISFAGREIKLNDQELESLKTKENGWPTSATLNEITAKEELEQEKAIPHAAAVWSKSISPGCDRAKLEIVDAVFLPLPDSQEQELRKVKQHQFRLTLHGYFFLDAGRQYLHKDKEKVQGRWNTRLRDIGTLPLVLPALSVFVKHAKLDNEEIRHLTQAFHDSECWKTSKLHLGKSHQWLYRINATGGNWSLSDVKEEYRTLPEPQNSQLHFLFEIFPALRDLSNRTIFTFENWPQLTTQGNAVWNNTLLNDLFAGVDAKRVFGNPQKFAYFNRVLQLLRRNSSNFAEIAEQLSALAREALIQLEWSKLTDCKEEWQDFLNILPDTHWIELKVDEDLLADILKLELKQLIVPDALSPHSDDQQRKGQLSLQEAAILCSWLEKTNLANSHTKLILNILTRTAGNLNERRDACGDYKLFKTRVWSSTNGVTETYLSWQQLESYRLRNQLWDYSGKEALLRAWINATKDTLFYSLVEDALKLVSKVLFEEEPDNFSERMCLSLLNTSPLLGDAQNRLNLFKLLLKDLTENDDSKKAFRYLLHSQKEHTADIETTLLEIGSNDL